MSLIADLYTNLAKYEQQKTDERHQKIIDYTINMCKDLITQLKEGTFETTSFRLYTAGSNGILAKHVSGTFYYVPGTLPSDKSVLSEKMQNVVDAAVTELFAAEGMEVKIIKNGVYHGTEATVMYPLLLIHDLPDDTVLETD